MALSYNTRNCGIFLFCFVFYFVNFASEFKSILLLVTAWISVKPSTVNSLFLEKGEFKYIEMMIKKTIRYPSFTKQFLISSAPHLLYRYACQDWRPNIFFTLKITLQGNDKEHSFHRYKCILKQNDKNSIPWIYIEFPACSKHSHMSFAIIFLSGHSISHFLHRMLSIFPTHKFLTPRIPRQD